MSRTIEKIILGVLVIAIFSISSVVIAGLADKSETQRLSSNAQQISPEQAKTIALGAVNTNDVGEITDVELERENGIVVYAIEFTKNGIETDVKINAADGTIIKIESDLDEKDKDEDISDVDDDSDDGLTSADLEMTGGKISEQQAISIAENAVDISSVGKMTDIELENEDGYIVYAIEFTKNGIETDVKIDAVSGKVLKIESDLDDGEED